jgi:sphingomyelin phosphodiesterase 4
LTYIQPWRYTDPLKPSSENKGSLEAVPRKWRGFVLDNFAFYSTLLMEIIGRSFQLDLTSDHGTILYRVAKVFSQPGLMGFINYGESLLLNPDPSSSSPRNSPGVDACSIKALFMDLDGPLFNYQPLLDDSTLTAVQLLLDKVREARAVVTSQLTSTSLPPSQRSPLPPPPLTPITPTAPAIHHTKSPWWRSVGGLFSDDRSSPFSSPSLPSSSSSPATDHNKLLTLLETTESNIMIMFGLSSPPQYSPSDGSPQWRPGIHTSVTPLRLATPLDHTPSNCPKSLEPEYVRGTSRLTPRGKMQLIQGLRKSSNLHVPYLGDPLLQPIRSYENAALVRCLHSLSTHLNDKFAQQLQLIGASNSLWSRLAKLFLSPVPSPYTHPTFTTE